MANENQNFEIVEDVQIEGNPLVQISPQLLVSVVQIIDLCSSRGAIQGPELFPIGTLREELVNRLKEFQENNK